MWAEICRRIYQTRSNHIVPRTLLNGTAKYGPAHCSNHARRFSNRPTSIKELSRIAHTPVSNPQHPKPKPTSRTLSPLLATSPSSTRRTVSLILIKLRTDLLTGKSYRRFALPGNSMDAALLKKRPRHLRHVARAARTLRRIRRFALN